LFTLRSSVFLTKGPALLKMLQAGADTGGDAGDASPHQT